MAVVFFGTLSNCAYANYYAPEKSVTRLFISYSLTYFLLGCILQAYHLILEECNSRFMQIRSHAEEQLRSKTMFVASVTHDLKNPLNSLLGFIDLLKTSKGLTKADKKNLMTASYSGQIMRYLIENILDASKLEIGKFDIDRIPMNIMDELKKILKIEDALTTGKNLRLYKKQLTPIPSHVYGDPMRFAQVLINLIGNSIKFTSKGYVAVQISWAKDAEEVTNLSAIMEGEYLIPDEEYFKERIDRTKFNLPIFTEPLDTNENLEESVCDIIDKHKLTYRGGHKACFSCDFEHMKSPAADSMMPHGLFSIDPSPIMPQCESGKVMGNNLSEIISGDDSDLIIFDNEENSDSGILVIDVIDTGIGMDAEETKKLFKPFTQANSQVRSKFGGTGLGLWITKSLVQRMCGVIEVRSQQGRGTRFTVTLPFKVVTEFDDYSPSPKNSEEYSRNERKTAPRISVIASKGNTTFATTLGSKTITSPINLSRITCRQASELRFIGKIKFKGTKDSLKGMRVLLIENDRSGEDFLIEQFCNQLRSTDCELSYATFTSAINILNRYNFKIDAVIIISANPPEITKKFTAEISQAIKESKRPNIQIAIACIMDMEHEYEEIFKDLIISVPFKEGDVVNLLLKMKSRVSNMYFLI